LNAATGETKSIATQFAPQGRYSESQRLAFNGADALAVADNDGMIGIWAVADGSLRHHIPAWWPSLTALTAAPDGSWFAAADTQGEIRIWNGDDGSPRHTLRLPNAQAHTLAATRSGRALLTGGDDGIVRCWDTNEGHVTAAVRLSQPISDLLCVGPTRVVARAPLGHYFLAIEEMPQS
jgi:WD40 repeat protein